jgi:hypothetical protein
MPFEWHSVRPCDSVRCRLVTAPNRFLIRRFRKPNRWVIVCVPTVLVQGGFKVRILLPPREHEPAHVHVHKAGGLVVIDLPTEGRSVRIRTMTRMRIPDVIAAVRLVEANAAMLLRQWRRHHG